jgi:transposase
MVWEGVWRDGRTDLVIMERDPDSRKIGYTAKSYQKALSEGLLPMYDSIRYFQQDNARIHIAGGTLEWLQEHRIEYINWPVHSPELNPIEHVWKALKANLHRMYPYLQDLTDNEANKQELRRCLQEAWRAIPQDQFGG